jgi:hypothetical protein
MNAPLRTDTTTDAGHRAGLVDPGWEDRRDETAAVVSMTVLLGVGCGVVIHWLGWPVGELLALVTYLACARLGWVCGVGGRS